MKKPTAERDRASASAPLENPAAPPAKSEVDKAIVNELAPAAAIALLEKTEHSADDLPPALEVLGAGVSPAESDTKIRVQLAFEGGQILPVEMSIHAGKALAAGIAQELSGKPAPSER